MTGLYLRFLLLLFTDFFNVTFSKESYETIELGCFSDHYPDGRALTTGPYKVGLLLNFTNTDSMSPAQCTERCWNVGYVYSGVEYGEECYCGDNSDYGRFGKLDSSKCWYGCYNNIDLMCGGANAIQITLAFQTTTTTLTSESTESSITVSDPLTSTNKSPTVTSMVHDNSTFYNKTEMTLLESRTAALRNTSLDGNGSGSDEIRFVEVQCDSRDITQYLAHGERTVDVDVGSNQVLSLEAGNHTYTRLTNDGNCTIRVSVIREQISSSQNASTSSQNASTSSQNALNSQNVSTTVIALSCLIGFLLTLGGVGISVVLYKHSSRRDTTTPCPTKEQERSSVVATNQAYNAAYDGLTDMDDHKTCATDYEMLGGYSLNDHNYTTAGECVDTTDVSPYYVEIIPTEGDNNEEYYAVS